MAIIQPFSFQFCTAFRERKQLADKTNEIIEVLNSADLENIPTEIEELNTKVEEYNENLMQNIYNLSDYVDAERVVLVNRINALEEEIDKPWILCPTDIELFDFNNNKVNYDLKIVYSLTYEYQHTDADNVNDDNIIGTIFMNKNDPIDATQSAIFKMQGKTSFDIYNIIFVDTGITFASIDYGISHSPSPTNIKGTSFNPLNGTCRVRTKTANVNYQTNNITVSFSNPFINIYYKGE